MNLLRYSKTIYTIAFLLATAVALPAAAQSLTPAEIDALKAQLVEARDIDIALGARLQCYVDEDASLQARSSQLQQTAGDLHQQEKKLSSELAQKKSEAEAFRRDLNATQREMNNLQRQMRKIEGQIRARQAALDDCKSRWYTINFMCDFAGEITGLNSELRNFSAQRNAAEIKARRLQEDLKKAQRRHKDAASLLQKKQTAVQQNKKNIAAVEAEIKVIKASLAEIRTVKQGFSAELRQFQEAIKEFESLDPGSDRRSVVRRLQRESAELDAQRGKVRVLLDKKGLQLPSGKRICAK
jgi:chromosome segregation ATPase